MAEFSARRMGMSLVPTGRAGEIELERLPGGARLQVRAVVPRNAAFHRGSRAFFSLLSEALNSGPTNGDAWSADDVKDHLLIATGRSRRIVVNGEPGWHAKSTNFSAMSDDEYSRFIAAAMLYVRNVLAPWIIGAPDWPEIERFLVWAGVSDTMEAE